MSRQYTEQQIQRLKELLNASQKALKLANAYYEQANSSYQACTANAQKLESAQMKFELLSTELSKQIQISEQIVHTVKARVQGFSIAVSQLSSSNEDVNRLLDEIFVKLKEKRIEPNIAANKTLHDFVDVESITNLQLQVSQNLRELKSMQMKVQGILAIMENQQEKLSKLMNNISAEYKPLYTNSSEKTQFQVNEINSISYVLISIAAQHDRVNHLYTNRDKGVADLTAVEKRTEGDLPVQISKIYDSLQRVEQVTKEIDQKVNKFNGIYKNASNILSMLEQFGVDTRSKLGEVDSFELSFEEKKEDTLFLLEELSNLTNWYNLFFTSYNELLYEISRRNKELKRQQEIVDSYQRELNLMWKMEEQKRDHFFEYYGKYLPQSLCPAIMELAPRFQIIPDKIKSELPQVGELDRPSRAHVDLALSQIETKQL